MKKIQVLVIDDSAFMRKIITKLLSEDKQIEVIATARNGKDGLKKIKEYQPDVITLDVEMPIMDGITTLQHIMERFPTPVIMVSNLTARGTESTIQAMQLGAIGFIQKPSGPISLDMDKVQSHMIETIIAATHANMKQKESEAESVQVLTREIEPKYTQSIYAIGTSTGGPRALQAVLTTLPANFNAPIVIVQHMPAQFTKSLATRLDSLCQIHVKEAEHGELLQNGVAYIAPGGKHMHVRQVGTSLAIEINNHELPQLGHRPSVNVLFKSLAPLKRLNKIVIILTGMGSDGTEGIKEIHRMNNTALIIAESRKTAVVNGMPSAAIRTNLVTKEVPLQSIGRVMVESLERIRG